MDEDVLNNNVNPDLYKVAKKTRETRTSIVYIDSRDDEVLGSASDSTDFTVKLPKPFRNIKSIAIKQITIPYVWYNVDSSNNEFFLISQSDTNGDDNYYAYLMRIPIGSYTTTSLAQTLTNMLSSINVGGVEFLPNCVGRIKRVATDPPTYINPELAIDGVRMNIKSDISVFSSADDILLFSRTSDIGQSNFRISFQQSIYDVLIGGGKVMGKASSILGFKGGVNSSIGLRLVSTRSCVLIPKTTRIFIQIPDLAIPNVQNARRTVFEDVTIKGDSEANKTVIIPFYEFTSKLYNDLEYLDRLHIQFKDPRNPNFTFRDFEVSLIFEIIHEE